MSKNGLERWTRCIEKGEGPPSWTCVRMTRDDVFRSADSQAAQAINMSDDDDDDDGSDAEGAARKRVEREKADKEKTRANRQLGAAVRGAHMNDVHDGGGRSRAGRVAEGDERQRGRAEWPRGRDGGGGAGGRTGEWQGRRGGGGGWGAHSSDRKRRKR